MRNLFRSTLVVGGVGLGLIAGMSPAYAAGNWETAGFKPVCNFASPFIGTILYADYGKPTVSAAITKITVVGNTPKSATLAKFRFKDSCSGLDDYAVSIASSGVITDQKSGTAPTDKSHDVTFPITYTLSPFDAGDYTFPYATAIDRWEVFGLNVDNKTLAGSPTARDTSSFQYYLGTEAYAKSHAYVLRQTKMTQTTSKTLIKKGSSVTVGGKLTFANGVTFANLASRTVNLQYLSGSTWRTAASKKTSASGTVSFVAKPSTTKKWRLNYPGQIATGFYAPISTAGTIVRVAS